LDEILHHEASVSVSLNFTESNIFAAVRSYLLSVLPSGIEVVKGLDNRVPEPIGPDFVTMTPVGRERIETNIDDYADAAFTGSITGSTLTITNVLLGALSVGATLLGTGIVPGTAITAFGTGTGGVGTYTISPAQTLASMTIAAGVTTLLQPTNLTIQLDVHGPNSANNTQIITTTWRDQYAVDQLASSGFDIAPLYSSEPKQIPFENAEQQIELRWTIDLVLQANQIVTVPQQFAAQLQAELIDVDVQYPTT
jgi:hypothetical protein